MIQEPLQIGSVARDPVLVMLALAGLAVLALFALTVTLTVHMSRRREEASAHEAQLSELKIRVQTLAESSVTRHGELARAVNERLDRMTHRVGTISTKRRVRRTTR
jgi:DNA recombination protein RmuC